MRIRYCLDREINNGASRYISPRVLFSIARRTRTDADGNFCGRRRRGRKNWKTNWLRTAARQEKNWLRTAGRTKKRRKNQSVSQTIDLIMTIKTSTGSSKTELSSRGKCPFKVYIYSLKLLAKSTGIPRRRGYLLAWGERRSCV